MEDAALLEIESRTQAYPIEAREDIARLIREVRRLRPSPPSDPAEYTAAHLHDEATGLLNAGAYGLRFAMARARATRYRKMFAVISVVFRKLAHKTGTSAADAELKDVAERIQACLRATDTLARVAHDRFAVILEDLSNTAQAERVKRNVEQALAEEGADCVIEIKEFAAAPA